jgi:hypothetical protein
MTTANPSDVAVWSAGAAPAAGRVDSPRTPRRDGDPHTIREVTMSESPPTEVLDFDAEGKLPSFPGVRHPLRSLAWIVRGAFGLANLLVLLAFIAAIPVVNFLALGYLLEVEGRVGRSGRWRDGFPLLGLAPRLGMIALGTYLWLLPLRLLATNAAAARIVAPGSTADVRLHTLLAIAATVVAIHLCLALARGGTLGCFLRPIKNVRWLIARLREGGYFESAARHVGEFVSGLRLRHHWGLGFRGFLAAGAWLLIPTVVYASVTQGGAAGGLRMFLGGVLLVPVLAWVPFLQARFAAENRWRAGFELGEVRDLFRHAPIAWLIAIVVTYVLALPLYLFKAFAPPQDALWPITLIFIATIYPTKLLAGWAYHRAVRKRREGRRSWFVVRWGVRLAALLPLLAVYVFILYFTQFLGVNGRLTLYEHHAFLLPWPYLVGVE